MFVNRSQLVTAVSESTQVAHRTVDDVVEALFGLIITEVRSGRRVTVVGFGTFTPTARAARTGRNPRTGTAVPIPASKGVRFATGSTFKKALNPNKEGAPMAVTKAAAKKAVRKAPAKKTVARKTAAKKTVVKKAVARKAPARKTAAKKTAVKKAPARKTAAKKTVAKKTVARKAPARKTAAKKTVARKATR
jgi:DNA-binding protein HU-beta